MNEVKIARVSAVIYTTTSIIVALLFVIITTKGEYTAVERYGGALWIFILTMIILMPLVIPFVKKKYHQ